jgi:tetratricopeptide (TPR) repeat protein
MTLIYAFKRFVFFAVLWLIGCAAAPPTTEQPSALLWLNKAEVEIARQNYEGAAALLDSAINVNPRLANLYRLKGKVLENNGQIDDAIASYEKFLQYRSNQPEVWRRLAQLHQKQERYEQASLYLKRTLQLLSDSLNLYLQLAEVQYRMKSYQAALNSLNLYRKRVENPVTNYWKWTGIVLSATGQYSQAIEALNRAMHEGINDAETVKALGIALFDAGKDEEAISLFNEKLPNWQSDPQIRVMRATYFAKRAKLMQAMEEVQKALELDRQYVPALFLAAQLAFRMQNYNESQVYLEKILQIDQTFWVAYRYLGLIAELNGDDENALKYYQLFLNNNEGPDSEVNIRMDALKRRLVK